MHEVWFGVNIITPDSSPKSLKCCTIHTDKPPGVCVSRGLGHWGIGGGC